MTDNQNFNSLDELFKKSFDNLPDAPSANGWDAPSDQVWQNIQRNIAAPASTVGGFSKILAAAAVLAIVAVAVYYFSKNDNSGTPAAPVQPPVEQPKSAQPVENQAVSQPAEVENSTSETKTEAAKTGKPASSGNTPGAKSDSKPKPKPPVNSTEKGKDGGAEKPQQHNFKSPATEKPNAPELPIPNAGEKPAREKIQPRNHDELHKQQGGGE